MRWLLNWFSVRWKQSSLDRNLSRLEKERKKHLKRLNHERQHLRGLQEEIDVSAVRVQELLDEGKQFQRRYEEQLDTMRSQLRVLEDMTVPAMVASNKLVLAELDAYTEVQVRKQVGGRNNEVA